VRCGADVAIGDGVTTTTMMMMMMMMMMMTVTPAVPPQWLTWCVCCGVGADVAMGDGVAWRPRCQRLDWPLRRYPPFMGQPQS
jgi:hypothetical protein